MFRLIEIYIRQGFPCLFHLITGFYCPGCGGTRAVKYLLHGQILKSIRYRPLVFYAVKRYQEFVYLGVVVILINWVLKNILLLYGIDLLTERL